MKEIQKSKIDENGQASIAGILFDVIEEAKKFFIVPTIETPNSTSFKADSDLVKGIEKLTHSVSINFVNTGKSKCSFYSVLSHAEAYVMLTDGLSYDTVITSAVEGKKSNMLYKAERLSSKSQEAIDKLQGGKDHATKKVALKSKLHDLLFSIDTGRKTKAGAKVTALDYFYDRLSAINGTELQDKATLALGEGQTSSMAVRTKDGVVTGGSAHWKTV